MDDPTTRTEPSAKSNPTAAGENVAKGKAGEEALNAWLKDQGLSYVAICQSPETFAPLFSTGLKRPDFLILLESIGLIAVDAKNYKQYDGFYTLKLEEELRRSMTFERVFRIPIWYAYCSHESGKIIWHWLSALKAIEVGEVRTNRATGEQFLAIRIEHFERVESNADLGKLYTHRLPGFSKIKTREP